MESPNTSSQPVELNPSCSGQACPNRPGTSPRHKNTEPGRIFTVLCIPFMVCPLKSADANSKRFCTTGTNGIYIFFSLGEHQKTHFKDLTRYDQGPRSMVNQGECHSQLAKLSWLDAGEYR